MPNTNNRNYFYVSCLDSVKDSASEVEILRVGKIMDRGFNVTMSMLEDFVKNFQDDAYGQELPVNMEHKRGSEAVGWFKNLYIQGESLMANIEWTKLGAEKLKDKIYKFISAELGDVKHHATGDLIKNVLLGAGLTNTPAMKKQTALTIFSEEAQYFLTKNNMDELKKLFDELIAKDSLSKEDIASFKASEHYSECDESTALITKLEEKVEEQEKAEEEKKAEEEEVAKKEEEKKELAEAKARELKLVEANKDVKTLQEELAEERAERMKLQARIELKELQEQVSKELCLSEEVKTGFRPDEEVKTRVANFMLGLSQAQRGEFTALLAEVRTVDLSVRGATPAPSAKTLEEKMAKANEEAQKRATEDNRPLHECLTEVYKEVGLDDVVQ